MVQIKKDRKANGATFWTTPLVTWAGTMIADFPTSPGVNRGIPLIFLSYLYSSLDDGRAARI
jgi:hypothetical protein